MLTSLSRCNSLSAFIVLLLFTTFTHALAIASKPGNAPQHSHKRIASKFRSRSHNDALKFKFVDKIANSIFGGGDGNGDDNGDSDPGLQEHSQPNNSTSSTSQVDSSTSAAASSTTPTDSSTAVDSATASSTSAPSDTTIVGPGTSTTSAPASSTTIPSSSSGSATSTETVTAPASTVTTTVTRSSTNPASSTTLLSSDTASTVPASTSAGPTSSAASTTSASASSSASATPSAIIGDLTAYLSAHNAARAGANAAPLSWSSDLAANAQSWASLCLPQTSGGIFGQFGENMVAATGGFREVDAVGAWVGEGYDPTNPVASHRTQVLWKSTERVGCAVATCFDIIPGRTAHLHVCQYDPPGNINGAFGDNVSA